MCITVSNGFLWITLFDLQDFPRLYQAYRGKAKYTQATETTGEKLFQDILKGNFNDVPRVRSFVKEVSRWCGRSCNRIDSNLYKCHTEREVAAIVGKAAVFLSIGNLESALETMRSTLKWVGISFGSKMLRMLSPRCACAYDSRLQTFLSYSDCSVGYAEFCADCKAVATELIRHGIENKYRKNGEWFAADVEAAIFEKLR